MTTFRTVTTPSVDAGEIRVETTRARATPPTAGRTFRDALGRTATAVLSGVEALSDVVPGGGAVTAAVRGARASLSSSGATSAEGPAASSQAGAIGPSDFASMRDAMVQDNMTYLRLQEEVQAENRRFTTLSNVMKAEHETAKNSIGNIR